MSFPQDVDSALSSLYAHLCFELRQESLPWVSQEDFMGDWWRFYQQQPGSRSAMEMKFQQFPSLHSASLNFLQDPDPTAANPIKSHLSSLVLGLKLTLLSLSSNSMLEEDSSMQVDPGLNNSQIPPSSGSPLLTSHLPDSYVKEMIDHLSCIPESSFDVEQSTSILSMSMDSPVAVEDPQERFQCGGIEQGNGVLVKKHPLQKLTRVSRKGVAGHPKKEYFRCQHIRGLKKSIRQMAGKKPPKASIHRISTDAQKGRWEALHEFYITNSSALRLVSDTAVGPATDGKKKKQQAADSSADPKSYNNPYCKDFFSKPVIQTYNALYSDLVYSGDPEEMCKKMKVTCCMGQHSGECEGIWQEVWEYARVGMLEELDLEVCVPERAGPEIETYLSSNI